MSRRDTIIIAALINAGLLIILFVSALSHPNAHEEISIKRDNTELSEQAMVVREEAKIVMGDEVDQVLKQYTQTNPLQTTAKLTPNSEILTSTQSTGEPQVKESATVLSAPSSNFIEDLQAITQPNQLSTPSSLSETVSTEPSIIEVKVKKGDVLEKIAKQHHTSVSEIVKVNHLSSTQLKIGQVLKIPSKSSIKSVSSSVATAETSSMKYYTVKTGDNPWTIAVKNHMKVEDLLKLNNMDAEKAKKLKPGDQIRIR